MCHTRYRNSYEYIIHYNDNVPLLCLLVLQSTEVYHYIVLRILVHLL